MNEDTILTVQPDLNCKAQKLCGDIDSATVEMSECHDSSEYDTQVQSNSKQLLQSSVPTKKHSIPKWPDNNADHKSSRINLVSKNLFCLNQPEKHEKSKRLFRSIKKCNAPRFLKGWDCSIGSEKYMEFIETLNEAYNSIYNFPSKQIVQEIKKKTGLSAIAIKSWFKWKREESGYSTPEQILSFAFSNSQYLNDKELKQVCEETGFEISFVQSWFWVSRVMSNIFDHDKVDKEELVLRRMFNLHRHGITDLEVDLMSYLLNANKRHIYQIFLTWCQRYEVANYMTCPKFDEDEVQISVLDENKKKQSMSFGNKKIVFESSSNQFQNPIINKDFEQMDKSKSNCKLKRSYSCPGALVLPDNQHWLQDTSPSTSAFIFSSTLASKNCFHTVSKLKNWKSDEVNCLGNSTLVPSSTYFENQDDLQLNSINLKKLLHDQIQSFHKKFPEASESSLSEKSGKSPERQRSDSNEESDPIIFTSVLKQLRKEQSLEGIPYRVHASHSNRENQIMRRKKRKRDEEPSKRKKEKLDLDSVQVDEDEELKSKKENQIEPYRQRGIEPNKDCRIESKQTREISVKINRKESTKTNKVTDMLHQECSPWKVVSTSEKEEVSNQPSSPAEELFDVLQNQEKFPEASESSLSEKSGKSPERQRSDSNEESDPIIFTSVLKQLRKEQSLEGIPYRVHASHSNRENQIMRRKKRKRDEEPSKRKKEKLDLDSVQVDEDEELKSKKENQIEPYRQRGIESNKDCRIESNQTREISVKINRKESTKTNKVTDMLHQECSPWKVVSTSEREEVSNQPSSPAEELFDVLQNQEFLMT